MQAIIKQCNELSELVPTLTFEYLSSTINVRESGTFMGAIGFHSWLDTEYDVWHTKIAIKKAGDSYAIGVLHRNLPAMLLDLGVTQFSVAKAVNKSICEELEELNAVLPQGLQVGTDGSPWEIIKKLRMMLGVHFENVPDSDAYFEAKSHFEEI
nr:hypothetical protein K-LCC10_0143 [Kaumoebavirus]